MPRPRTADHGTPARWRTGCRCSDCLAAHNAESRDLRRHAADRALPPAARRRILAAVRRGRSMTQAADAAGVTAQAIWGRARVDAGWRDQLNQALVAGRDPEVPHGTLSGWRWYRCRCPECRAALWLVR